MDTGITPSAAVPVPAVVPEMVPPQEPQLVVTEVREVQAAAIVEKITVQEPSDDWVPGRIQLIIFLLIAIAVILLFGFLLRLL